jgi:hypothetical protein
MTRIDTQEQATFAAVPPPRDALPTVPCDLSEYARLATGPLSWSAPADGDAEADIDDLFGDLLSS